MRIYIFALTLLSAAPAIAQPVDVYCDHRGCPGPYMRTTQSTAGTQTRPEDCGYPGFPACPWTIIHNAPLTIVPDWNLPSRLDQAVKICEAHRIGILPERFESQFQERCTRVVADRDASKTDTDIKALEDLGW